MQKKTFNRLLKWAVTAALVIPMLMSPFGKIAHAALEDHVRSATRESMDNVRKDLTKLINSNQSLTLEPNDKPLEYVYRYQAGKGMTHAENSTTHRLSATVFKNNPIYTFEGVDRSLISVTADNPTSANKNPLSSSISIRSNTNGPINTSFYINVKKVYTVYQTFEWSFWSAVKKTMHHQFFDMPWETRFIVYVQKESEFGDVLISYEDADTGKKVIDDSEVFGKLGTEYNTAVREAYQKKLPFITHNHYHYVNELNTVGLYQKQLSKSTFYFEKNEGSPVTVKHLNYERNLSDKQTEAFGPPPDDRLVGKHGQMLKAKAKKLPYYSTLDGVTEKNVRLTEYEQDVQFMYRLDDGKPLTVTHVDEHGELIKGVSSQLISGRWGDAYEVTPRQDLPYYELTSSSKPQHGYLTNEPQTITFAYERVTGADVTLRYRDHQGKKLREDKVLSGLKHGTHFREEAPFIAHYTPQVSQVQGEVTMYPQELTFRYELVDANPVEVSFTNEVGEAIAQPYYVKGKYGEAYDVSATTEPIAAVLKDLETQHYQLIKVDGKQTGTLTDEANEQYTEQVVYLLTKKAAPGIVTVKHINMANGKEIIAAERFNGKYDEPYQLQARTIEGYHLVSLPAETTGVFGATHKTAYFGYKGDPGGAVIVRYLDAETAVEIAEATIITGRYADDYQAEAQDVRHYTSKGVPANASGTIPRDHETIHVDFHYERSPAKNVTISYVDEDDQSHLAPVETLGEGNRWGDGFSSQAQTFAGYNLSHITKDDVVVETGDGLFDDEREQTIVYHYSKKAAAAVVVSYLNEETGAKLLPDQLLHSEDARYGDAFEASPPSINGNLLSTVSLNGETLSDFEVTGTYTDEQQYLIYYYFTDQTALEVQDSTLYTSDSWQPADNYVTARDERGNELGLADVMVEGEVDVTTPGRYEVVYTNATVSKTATIEVKQDQTGLTVQDISIYEGDDWQPSDNFVQAIDKDGQLLTFADISVAGAVNTSVAGRYELLYTNGIRSETAYVTVLANQTSLNVKDSDIYVGDKWQPVDNFIKATDQTGNPIPFEQVTVSGAVDIAVPGHYEVSYQYGHRTVTAIVTVKPNLAAITVKNSTLSLNSQWQPADNFVAASGKDGTTLPFTAINVTGSVDVTKAGRYEVTYRTPDEKQAEAIITVLSAEADQSSLIVRDLTLTQGATWHPQAHFVAATDQFGKALAFEDLSVIGEVDTAKLGETHLTFTTPIGLSKRAKVTVVAKEQAKSLATLEVINSVLTVGDKWQAKDNFVKATNHQGDQLAFADITVSGHVDTSKSGDYYVDYLTADGLKQTAQITVKPKDNGKKGNPTGGHRDNPKTKVMKSKDKSKKLPQTGATTNSEQGLMTIGVLLLLLSVVIYRKTRNH